MITQNIDNIFFEMEEAQDFSFLDKYGRVFQVFSQNDSGNISFGVENNKSKYFVKVAGAKTARAETSPQEAIKTLKQSVQIYKDLAHPNLIQLVDSFELNHLFVTVFRWSDGECLFDYWNFDDYKRKKTASPREMFKWLSVEKRLNAFKVIFDFLMHTEARGYVAIDFYDGSLMYDFKKDALTICDIDFFRKSPSENDMGESFWGTKRLKSPEEYTLGSAIDSVTNVFTLGALIFNFFGSYSDEEMANIYAKNCFFPCRREAWELDSPLYDIALKAVNPDRADRYASICDFYNAWTNANLP